MILKRLLLLSLIFTTFGLCAQHQSVFYNVKDYGAKADGTTLDVKAINATIDAASKQGGGTVYFPAGNYLTGSIHLKNYITLYIDNGATIIAAPVNAANGNTTIYTCRAAAKISNVAKNNIPVF